MSVATKKLLLDVREAGESILQNTANTSLAEYSRSRLLRRAVEREFEIVGEAPVVWGVAEKNLPLLVKEVTVLFEAEEGG